MRFVIQRVREAFVDVAGERAASIGEGLLVLAGFGPDDSPATPSGRPWKTMLDKTLGLRVFPDAQGRMNVNLRDHGGQLLLVPQFTLYADCSSGFRPGFSRAAPPETARALFDVLAGDFARAMAPKAPGLGVFGADMNVGLVNWGPVTILLDSADFAP
ncbi:D-aminoacyl-tRNA deacylase [Fundidesulfovibrio magnetotacticus]|uniref:D-aminoacyl-tRNA deacylase n=1 Tax=Fundidesulfovibrio magnetotacticus TaxID=2730080 RepID=A0A6V8LSH0_9BACT|nr:D-aminoacyl-tRNA deacylase [Fundidesulfovibrio magnetotacticus]GFK93049.1 D-aminoacyl-tRNA deacylase [Fundidesulfovibrio magnetotacticus]